MRVLTLSLVVFVIVLVFGVFGHHMMTVDRLPVAIIGMGAGLLVCWAISLAAISAAKKEFRLWPQISAAVVHLIGAGLFWDGFWSPYYAQAYRATSAIAGTSLALCGVILLFSRAKKEPIKSSLAQRP